MRQMSDIPESPEVLGDRRHKKADQPQSASQYPNRHTCRPPIHLSAPDTRSYQGETPRRRFTAIRTKFTANRLTLRVHCCAYFAASKSASLADAGCAATFATVVPPTYLSDNECVVGYRRHAAGRCSCRHADCAARRGYAVRANKSDQPASATATARGRARFRPEQTRVVLRPCGGRCLGWRCWLRSTRCVLAWHY